jgi:hypothetical protein
MAGLESDKADVTDHVNAGLWRPEEAFGGLVEVTIADLQALTCASAARQAGDRFDVAITEAQAHQGLQARASASARWLTEAAHQLHTVRRSHRDLQRHTNEHPSPIASAAANTVAALRARIEDTYRRRTANHPNQPASPPSTRQPAA